MRIPMKVFSVDTVVFAMEATLPDGSKAMAPVPGKRVQLVSDVHGSWTLNLSGADAAAWESPAGAAVDVDI